MAGRLPPRGGGGPILVAGILLALFLVLILFDTRLAMIALVLAIVTLYRKRTAPAGKPKLRY
jgi:hypothetical protein